MPLPLAAEMFDMADEFAFSWYAEALRLWLMEPFMEREEWLNSNES